MPAFLLKFECFFHVLMLCALPDYASMLRPMPFNALGLAPELLQALKPKSYPAPTPVQSESIPPVLEGRDVLVSAPTGSGKTAAYALPLLQRWISASLAHLDTPHTRARASPQALILLPTRELAVQVGQTFRSLAVHLPKACRITVVFGGVSINPQMMGLRGGCDILVATPGRLLDLMAHNAVQLQGLESLVLDEADRLLDLGFQDELSQILAVLPARRQTLFFSATLPESVLTLSQTLLNKPVRVDVMPQAPQPSVIMQRAILVDRTQRTQLLKHLMTHEGWRQVLVFAATQHACDMVATKLRNAGISAEPFHGQLSQGKRSQVLADFKAGRLKVVLSTDLASRGIDIQNLPCVVNFDLPRSAVDYTHRIGRTGRAGQAGDALSFVSPSTQAHWHLIEKRHAVQLKLEVLPGFEPTEPVPVADPTGGVKGLRPSKKDKLRRSF